MSFHKSAGNLLQKDLFINNNDIYFASSNDWNGNLIDVNNISNIGTIIYTSYNIWLIITGFILLLAMVGAIIITLKKTKRRD
jgi:NADH-ubiquinone oxidoreductase chain 6